MRSTEETDNLIPRYSSLIISIYYK